MSNPSNLYAEKIYSEHPLVLWALDDQADYVSLITDAKRNMASFPWDDTDSCTISSGSLITGEPFPDSPTSIVSCNVPAGASGESIILSPDIVNFQDLNTTLGTFSIGSYFYIDSLYINSISIGYEYTDTTTLEVVQKSKTFSDPEYQSWSFMSETFEIPEENTNFKIIIKILTSSGGATSADYKVYFNGITTGQWSEEFHKESLGVTPASFPATIAIDTTDTVIPAAAYGVSSDTAYYLVKNNALLAKNTSIPLVFGASGLTKIIPNTSNKPSLVFPGQGFLNKSGQHKEYTVEFWARIIADSPDPKRIFGPIASTDGLYVDSGFLTLVVGGKSNSHFVGEWFRPMLIHIRLIKNSVTVLLNGEQVIEISIDTASLLLPDLLDESVPQRSQDWLGFYAYDNVSLIEVDCLAIYSYQVSVSVAKRRWVYGQGVSSAQSINSSYGGTSAFIDYSFSNYTANYNYPSFAQWQQGSFDNLETTSLELTTPSYSLPNIFLDTKSIDDLYTDCKAVQTDQDSGALPYKFLSFRPNSTWAGIGTYLNFPKLNILNDKVKSVYGVFSSGILLIDGGYYNTSPTDSIDAEYYNTTSWAESYDAGSYVAEGTSQTLIKIYNTLTDDFFVIRLNGDIVEYVLNYNEIEETVYTTEAIESEQLFAVGINIDDLSNVFGGNVSAFFGNVNGLKVYVAGDEEITNSFSGKIYSLGFTTELNHKSISDYFNEYGVVNFDDLSISGVTEETNALALINHLASYTLLPIEAYDEFFLDIGVSGHWQDYLPLSYFAKYVNNAQGASYYDLDFLQFNLGHSSPSKLLEKETTSSWTYEDLKQQYSAPIQQTYYQIDNSLITGWNDYEDLAQKALKYYEYDTSESFVKSYITFQYVAEGANALDEHFTIDVPAKEGSIIDIDNYPDWVASKFEVVDNTIIYPSKSIDFNDIAIVYSVDFNVRGIINRPVKIKKLEIASQALSDNSFNSVGTKFGVDLVPYKKSGIYFDYKSKNPFSIYKSSTPYLYLTKNSGIEVRGDFAFETNRGIAMPINKELSDEYRVSSMQAWMFANQDSFSASPIEIFEIEYKEDIIKFYMVADSPSGSRAKIYALSSATGTEYTKLTYFWNGVSVQNPVITIKEWGSLGLQFSSALKFDLYIGAINLNGPMLFNNISFYQANNLQQVQSVVTRPWLKVKTSDGTNWDWTYWSENYDWQETLVVSSSELYGVNPTDVYKNYLGTNKIIIDDNEGMTFDANKMKIYTDTTWQTNTLLPV
jgi:hypothetical protein